MTATIENPTAHPLVSTTVTIGGEADLLRVRSTMRAYARQAGLGLTATTKVVTAGSELARNILRYATCGQGIAAIEEANSGQKRGVRATFTDVGPGIADLDLAMRSGFSTAESLGLGLPGSRRLVDEFDIDSAPGRGTRVAICQWDR
ncbi:MAG: serine/threonine-protein kinase RsbT [Streptosporangiaceae bacterium]|jgi:serine/threonine-protein kinase RsbT|nr:serine/threonine-protein kinase RsbT [Streptosporangiaceae bacterium]